MTREEAAIKSCEDRIKHLKSAPTHHYGKRQRERAIELEKVKIKALRPVSREWVEKVFPGCALCNWGGLDFVGVDGDGIYLSKPAENEKFRFCPVCGKPLTDEAVEDLKRKWEDIR